MKKVIYALTLSLVAVGGLVYANREIKNEAAEKVSPKPLTEAEKSAARRRYHGK